MGFYILTGSWNQSSEDNQEMTVPIEASLCVMYLYFQCVHISFDPNLRPARLAVIRIPVVFVLWALHLLKKT